MWITNFLVCEYISLRLMWIRGGGDAYPQNVDNVPVFFLNPSLKQLDSDLDRGLLASPVSTVNGWMVVSRTRESGLQCAHVVCTVQCAVFSVQSTICSV